MRSRDRYRTGVGETEMLPYARWSKPAPKRAGCEVQRPPACARDDFHRHPRAGSGVVGVTVSEWRGRERRRRSPSVKRLAPKMASEAGSDTEVGEVAGRTGRPGATGPAPIGCGATITGAGV